MAGQDNIDYTGRKLGRTQFIALDAIRNKGSATTKEIHDLYRDELCLRTLQESLRTLHRRGLITRKDLRHNKFEWYYSTAAETYLEFWPELPPQAKKP